MAAAGAAAAAAVLPAPPDPPPQGGPAAALDAVYERLNELAGRLVGVETSVQSLRQGAQATLAELLTQARAEFATQHDSLVALRLDAQQEAGALRAYLEETRQATEQLYAGASSGFATLQAEVQGQSQEPRPGPCQEPGPVPRLGQGPGP